MFSADSCYVTAPPGVRVAFLPAGCQQRQAVDALGAAPHEFQGQIPAHGKAGEGKPLERDFLQYAPGHRRHRVVAGEIRHPAPGGRAQAFHLSRPDPRVAQQSGEQDEMNIRQRKSP